MTDQTHAQWSCPGRILAALAEADGPLTLTWLSRNLPYKYDTIKCALTELRWQGKIVRTYRGTYKLP